MKHRMTKTQLLIVIIGVFVFVLVVILCFNGIRKIYNKTYSVDNIEYQEIDGIYYGIMPEE